MPPEGNLWAVTARVRQFRLHFFGTKRNAERSHFPLSRTKTNTFKLINSMKYFSVRSELGNAHIFPHFERKRYKRRTLVTAKCALFEFIIYFLFHIDERRLSQVMSHTGFFMYCAKCAYNFESYEILSRSFFCTHCTSLSIIIFLAEICFRSMR